MSCIDLGILLNSKQHLVKVPLNDFFQDKKIAQCWSLGDERSQY